jgi:hypothetical protein
MSDERQAFEQLHAIPSGAIWCENRDVYIHKNYSGLVLHPINESWEAFCEGALWQASREGVGGDSESIIGFHNALQRVKKIFSEYRQDWPKWGKRLDGTPALNDLPVRIAAAFSELYTQPVSFGADDYPDCDTCGASINYMPWHYSKGTDRHLHSCDMCWPKVNPASRQAVSVPQQWRDTMAELAADLESEIENRRSGDLDRRIERDLIVVREARALLAEQEQDQ